VPAKSVTKTSIVVLVSAGGRSTKSFVGVSGLGRTIEVMFQAGGSSFCTNKVRAAACVSTTIESGILTLAFRISRRCWFGNCAVVDGAV